MKINLTQARPQVPFYSLEAKMNTGQSLSFNDLKGKKVLLVNTASACGYTPQYEELQQLYEQEKGKLMILGFPSNEFGGQEPGTDEEIAGFCKVNFGVSFPLAAKSSVLRGPEQNKTFEWLTNPAENGWNAEVPAWNFTKYLVNEQGVLTHVFESGVSPTGDEMRKALDQ